MSLTDYQLAKSASVEKVDGRRRITIDGTLFPHFTQGDIETRPAAGGHGTILLVPLFIDGPVAIAPA